MSVLLHLALVLLAARAIERASWVPGMEIVLPAAALGALCALGLAKAGVPDLIAHLQALMAGGLLSVGLTAWALDELGGTLTERLRFLTDRGQRWYELTRDGRQADDRYLFLVVMSVTVWLVAYSSGWMLYRRGWLLAAVALPGAVIVINLGYQGGSTTPLLLFLVAAGVLASRHFAYRRSVEWARARMPAPDRLPWHFLRTGLTIVLLAVAAGWSVPHDAPAPLVSAVAERLQEPWDRALGTWDDAMSRFQGSTGSAGSFSSFSQSFELGGALNLSDDPVALVTADRPVYLAAQRYDRYSGAGWSTDVQRTFRPNGGEGGRAPLITFEPSSGVFLSDAVSASRTPASSLVTIYRPKGDLMLTTDTYFSSSVRASVQLGWQTLRDAPYDIQDLDPDTIPQDLRTLAALLQEAAYPGSGTDADPPEDPEVAQALTEAKTSLAQRFLRVRWTVGDDGQVETLYVSGQLPVYDDVEAVRADQPPKPGDRYLVTGAASLAVPPQLRQAGTDYPDYVTARYLQLPGSVTDRTVQLAGEIAGEVADPFDQAVAIQDFLRENYTNDEKIDAPPAGRDVVDYLLFESKRGYCEYYASAMAVMLRTLDIPARMVAGYRSVPFDEGAQGYLYREKQAHTWVEAFFPGYGWIPFEPTPISERFDYGDEAAPEPLSSPTPEPTTEPEPEASPVAGTTDDRTGARDRSGFDRAARLENLPVALSVLVGAAILGAVAIWLWSLRGLTPAGGLYARLLRLGRWWGVPLRPTMTPAEFADEVGRVAPRARQPAETVAALYAREQYAGRMEPDAVRGAGRQAWQALRRSALRTVPRRRGSRR